MEQQNMLSVVQIDASISGLSLKKELDTITQTITSQQQEHPNVALLFMTRQQRYFHNAKAFHKMLSGLNQKYRCGFIVAIHDTPFESEEVMLAYAKEHHLTNIA